MKLLREAVEVQKLANCERCQAYFDQFPDGYITDPSGWRLGWCCGSNMGIGSDTGYGVGFACKKDCKIRIPLQK